jgi:hypothetical protein
LKQIFHIENGPPKNEEIVLSLELGEKHSSFAVTDKSGTELYELAYCTVEEWNSDSLTIFFSRYPCLGKQFYKIKIAYDYPEAVLIPSAANIQDGAVLLKTIFGKVNGRNVISELIPEWQLYNTYSVPAVVQQWLNSKYLAANYYHKYSIAVKNSGSATENGKLIADFRTDDFTLLATKSSRLLLASAFQYTTPEDVIFYLLKACQQFSLSQREVQLQLSGLIDKQSALYKELYQYFINVEFREAGWHAGNEYPGHFFTSLNDLARCAS